MTPQQRQRARTDMLVVAFYLIVAGALVAAVAACAL